MADNYVEAIRRTAILEGDRPIGNSKHRCSDGSAIVNARVKFPYVKYQIDSPAKPGRNTQSVDDGNTALAGSPNSAAGFRSSQRQ